MEQVCVHSCIGVLQVNNAAIAQVPGQDTGDISGMIPLSQLPVEDAAKQFAIIYQTNVFAVVTVTNAFLPLLRKAPAGRIVNVSSTRGSFTKIKPVPPTAAYSTSKSALNALTTHYAEELKATPIKINSVCPGYCATDMNNHQGLKSASEGAAIAVTMGMLPADGPTGGFFDSDGPIPW